MRAAKRPPAVPAILFTRKKMTIDVSEPMKTGKRTR